MNFASGKFQEAALTFVRVHDQLCGSGSGRATSADLMCVIADMDAAIPGLSGAELGHAYVTKAACLYYDCLFFRGPRCRDFFSPEWRPPPEALRFARKGRTLIARHDPEQLPWADEILESLQELKDTPTLDRRGRKHHRQQPG